MIAFLKTPFSFILFSLSGAVIIVIGSLIAGIAYRGKEGERYSPFNHFISELGEVGVSRLAWVFNLCLILTGLCLMMASFSLGLMLPGILAKLAMAAGVICAISLSLVGIFPMNRLKPHGYAAMTYFRAGLAMVILFSLAFVFQPGTRPVLSRWLGLAGLPPIMAFSAFLILIRKAYRHRDDPLGTEDVARPKAWDMAIVEWLIFVTILFWYLSILIGL